MFELIIEDSFSAAHRLKNYKGNCENLHGHNWKVQMVVESEKLDDIGLAIDFRDLKKVLNEVLRILDHKYLNDIEYFQKHNTSSEHIAKFIYTQVKERLKEFPSVRLKKIICWESEKSAAAYFE